MKQILGILLTLASTAVLAHTWNEPWHKDVVAESETFGLYEVLNDPEFSLKLKLLKHLAGEKTKEKINVSKYYFLERTSHAQELNDHPFGYKKGQKVYAYLKKEGEKYSIATPTAGLDHLMDDGRVAATFRHTLHRAKASTEDYETLQVCIFNRLHSLECSLKALDLVSNTLKEPVGTLSENASKKEVDRFFRQHGALETSYLASLNNSIEVIEPFLESDFFHVQISAVRALWASNFSDKEKKLTSFITSKDKDGMAKIMAIILLKDSSSQTTIHALQSYLEKASNEDIFLGGSFMDPRVGTWYPKSVKTAIEWFLTENKASNKLID